MPEFPRDVHVSLFIALTVKIHYRLAPSEWLLQVSVSMSSMSPTGKIPTTKIYCISGFSIHTVKNTISWARPCCLPAASVSHKPSMLRLMVLPIPTALLEGLFQPLSSPSLKAAEKCLLPAGTLCAPSSSCRAHPPAATQVCSPRPLQ